MAEPSVDLLIWDPNGIYVDFTAGGGGHSRLIAARLGDSGCLIGCDRDADAIAHCRKTLPSNAHLVQCRFSEACETLKPLIGEGASGVLMDLGMSSHQINESERGFSYLANGPLDLRMDRSRGQTAASLLARADEREIEGIIRDFGEDPQARRIARSIIAARQKNPIRTTGELADVIRRAVPATQHKSLPRVFQALRIAVNAEMAELDAGLAAGWNLLKPGGRLVVISYHSLEDRRVKQFMKNHSSLPDPGWGLEPEKESSPDGRLLTKKPMIPSAHEIQENPRARSAKLRAMERIH